MENNTIIASKFYFISPVDILNQLIDSLIRLEFETYIINGDNKFKIFNVLDKQSQHIIFISLRNRKEALEWLEITSNVVQSTNLRIKLGAFVYSHITDDLKDDFQKNGIEIIPLSRISGNAIYVVKEIVPLFNAYNRRRYIRAKADGTCLALLQKRNKDRTIRAEIIDISSHTFSCRIDPKDEGFLKDKLYRDVFLSLRGMQLQVSARLLDHRDEGPMRTYLFAICGDGRETARKGTSQKIPSFIRKRLFSFIKNFLSTYIRQRLAFESEGYSSGNFIVQEFRCVMDNLFYANHIGYPSLYIHGTLNRWKFPFP
jgi:hypothetical protein